METTETFSLGFMVWGRLPGLKLRLLTGSYIGLYIEGHKGDVSDFLGLKRII